MRASLALILLAGAAIAVATATGKRDEPPAQQSTEPNNNEAGHGSGGGGGHGGGSGSGGGHGCRQAHGSPISYRQGGRDWTGECTTHRRQSPMALVTPAGAGLPATLTFEPNWETSSAPMTLWNDGHTLRMAKCATENTFGKIKFSKTTSGNGEYHFDNFHLHAPGEHPLDGHVTAAELHIVHHLEGNPGRRDAVVITILLDPVPDGESHDSVAFFDTLLSGVTPPMADNSHVTVTGVDFTWIKNWMTANSYLVYSGSLTTPPCTPVVRFLVSTKTAYISSAALAKLVGQWAGNQSFAGGRGNARNFFLPAAGRQVVLHRRP